MSFVRSEGSDGGINGAVSCRTTSSVWTVGFDSSFSWRGDFEIGWESSSTVWVVDCGEIQGTRICNILDSKEGRAVAEDICEGARVDASATEFTIGRGKKLLLT